MYIKLWDRLKREVNEGTAKDCFRKTFYENGPKRQSIDDLLAAYTCGGLVDAGSETTSTTLNNFMLAMVLPRKLQERSKKKLIVLLGLIEFQLSKMRQIYHMFVRW